MEYVLSMLSAQRSPARMLKHMDAIDQYIDSTHALNQLKWSDQSKFVHQEEGV